MNNDDVVVVVLVGIEKDHADDANKAHAVARVAAEIFILGECTVY